MIKFCNKCGRPLVECVCTRETGINPQPEVNENHATPTSRGASSPKRRTATIVIVCIVAVIVVFGATGIFVADIIQKNRVAMTSIYPETLTEIDPNGAEDDNQGFNDWDDSAEVSTPTEQTQSVSEVATEPDDIPYTPVSDEAELFKMTPFSSEFWYPDQGNCQDSLGGRYNTNTVSYVISGHFIEGFSVTPGRYYDSSQYSWGEYRIDGKYTKLKGKYASHEGMEDGEHNSVVIYADSGNQGDYREVFRSKNINRKTELVEFDIEIGSDVQYLRIDTQQYGTNLGNNSMILLDFRLYN